MKLNLLLAGVAIATVSLVASAANAGVTYSTDAGAFGALGTITQTFNFDSYPTGNFAFPGDPLTIGDVTFSTGSNLIVGAGLYGNGRNAIANNYWTPLPGSIAGTHDLFGFDLTLGGEPSQIDVTVTTNLGSYLFSDVQPTYNTGTFSFEGFQAGPGEYFTGFNIVADAGSYSLPLTTDFELGTAGGAVPEPATWAMMLVGVGAIGSSIRASRRKQVSAAATA